MSEVDPVKDARDAVAGLAAVYKVIKARALHAEQVLADAEADHDTLLKLEVFTLGLLNSARVRLKALEDCAKDQ